METEAKVFRSVIKMPPSWRELVARAFDVAARLTGLRSAKRNIDLTSDVYEFTPYLESLDDLVDAHKDEFKALKPFLDKAGKRDRAEEVLQKCIIASPEYKLPDPLPKSKI